MLEDVTGLSKLIELGALGIVNVLLVFKGISKMQTLSDTIFKGLEQMKNLADAVKTLSDGVSKLQLQFESNQRRLDSLEARIVAIEQFLREELREIKFDIEHLKSERSPNNGKSLRN